MMLKNIRLPLIHLEISYADQTIDLYDSPNVNYSIIRTDDQQFYYYTNPNDANQVRTIYNK